MGVLTEPRLERLAQELARGSTTVDASRIAGYKPRSSFASNARKRANRKDVKARVLEIQTISGVLAAADAAYLERKALEIIEVPLVADEVSTSDRLKAMDFIAKIKGFFAPEKHDMSFVNHGDKLDAALKRLTGS
jgi:hypothetical protein